MTLKVWFHASIVITTFNRAALLRKTLESFVTQDFKDFEVIIVDDGTDIETPGLCEEDWPFSLKHFRLNRPRTTDALNQAMCVNFGVKQANSDIIILQNAECLHVGNVIGALVAAVTPGTVALCRVEHLSEDGTNLGVLPSHNFAEEGDALFFCGAIYKQWFYHLRGMDEDFIQPTGEDNDFSNRLKSIGLKFDYLQTTVQHQWHPPAGNMRPEAVAMSLELLTQKNKDMADGRIGARRNRNRQWGDLAIAPTSENRIVQSLWIGKFTTMERLCALSFLKNGHSFHLYTYGKVEGVPAGVVVRDANAILPEKVTRLFPSLQQAADFFRVALLLQRGGWWVDMDTVCLKPFDFTATYVFGASTVDSIIPNSPMKVPSNSPMMQYWFDFINRMGVMELSTLPFQSIGPDFLGRAVPKFGLKEFVQPRTVFDPIRWDRTSLLVDPNAKWDLTHSYAIHLCHAAWNNGHEAFAHAVSPQTDGNYPADCLYEQLKKLYL